MRQSRGSTECPKISTFGPSGVPNPGDPITFTATVEPAGKDLKYKWSISDGKLLKGQGTLSIEVETPKKDYGITATVEITGLPTGCPNTMSDTVSLTIRYRAELLDEIGVPITVKHKFRFEAVNTRLRNDSLAKLVVVLYSRTARRRAMDRRAILKYLHPPEDYRVTFVDGPDRGDGGSVKFWLVPSGASDPEI